MDEYLFITMAKLKADRLRLEREQRAEKPTEESRKPSIETQARPVRTSWFSRAPQWSKQS